MDTMQAPEPTHTLTTLSTEDYWARMQALRDDLARLRPPGPAPRPPRGPEH